MLVLNGGGVVFCSAQGTLMSKDKGRRGPGLYAILQKMTIS